jgi:hypothetical protein
VHKERPWKKCPLFEKNSPVPTLDHVPNTQQKQKGTVHHSKSSKALSATTSIQISLAHFQQTGFHHGTVRLESTRH